MSRTPLKLGTRVLIRAFLDRVAEPGGFAYVRRPFREPIEGLIIGKRTLWESEWDDEGWGRYLHHFAAPVPAYLVAPDLRHFYKVHPNDIEEVPCVTP